MRKIFIALAALTASTALLTSCEDMMTVDSGDKAYENAQDTLYSYLGIMRAMQDIAERQVILGEIRGDLVSSTDYATDTLFAISNFDNPQDKSCSMLNASDYYNVINNCNFYIHNCDTNAVKSNIKFMIPEYAQVKAIRAWAYLQLVKNYREVPFITQPVSNLDVVKDFNYQANLVNKDNLVDRLIDDGLLQLADTRYPQYGNTSNTWGTWQNGDVSISARLCFIPIRVVLGDLYLLRGAGESDYRQAARYYYEYLKQEETPLYLQGTTATKMRNGRILDAGYNNWGNWAKTYTYSTTTNELITTIPSAANAGLGKMLTRVADIYGYTPSSSQSSAETLDEDENSTGESEVSGSINVIRNYKRQYCPSEAYSDVNNDQTFITYKESTIVGQAEVKDSITRHDARFGRSVDTDFSYEGQNYPLCSKAALGYEFYYTIPVYRKTLIWLRLAEAINRAGYPEFAFAILKDGLNQYTLPVMKTLSTAENIIVNIAGADYYTKTNSETGQIVYLDTADVKNVFYYDDEGTFTAWDGGSVNTAKWQYDQNVDYYRAMTYATRNPLYYLTDTLRLTRFNQFLNFTDDVWNSTYGIHARGTGILKQNTNGAFTLWTSSNTGQVITNIYGNLDDEYYDYNRQLWLHGLADATAATTLADTIDAMENIIVDELALETAFEGNRFTDLVRIAQHKNASGRQGTQWLANKIANRGTRKATSTLPAVDGYDGAIYAKLLNPDNWYFALPAW